MGMQSRLTLVLAALVMAVATVVGGFALRETRERGAAEIDASLRRDTRAAALWATDQGLVGAGPPAHDAWVRRAAESFSGRVALLDGEGRLVADSALRADDLGAREPERSAPEIAAALAGRSAVARRSHPSTRADQFHAASPVMGPGAAASAPPTLVVRLTRDASSIQEAVAALRGRIAAGGAVGLLVAIVVGWVVRRIALDPIDELRDVVAAVARGELHRRARRSNDPVGEIAGSINAMAEQLRMRLDEMTAEKEQLDAVLTSMVEGVLVLDDEGRVLLINPPARELLSVWGDIRGQRPLSVVRNAALADALAQASEKGEVVVTELESFGSEERSILVHAVGFPAEGPSAGSVAVFHDVTEIRQLEQVRRDFIANASHELRTPLTSIQGYAETLGSDELGEEQRSQYTQAILRNARRLGALISDLLSLSRIESRKSPMNFGNQDLARICQTMVEDLQPRMREARIECTTQLEKDTFAWADGRAVEQVITNLLDNAIKYTEPGGTIELACWMEGPYARVRVGDSGIGIPEADRARIFERFYRVDKARSRALGGTGLGLAIVKHLLQNMSGEITVRSQPGEGSDFTFTLPRQPS